MIKKSLILIPAALLMVGCATAKKCDDLETRVQILEGKAGISASAKESAVMTAGETATSSKEMSAPDSPTKRDIQAALKNSGFYSGPVDGKLGPKTKKSIEEFQAANGLAADGKVGANTWSKLKKYYVPETTETTAGKTK